MQYGLEIKDKPPGIFDFIYFNLESFPFCGNTN